MNFFKKKTFEEVKESAASSALVKSLGAFDLVMIGLGAIVGTGVFVFSGQIYVIVFKLPNFFLCYL